MGRPRLFGGLGCEGVLSFPCDCSFHLLYPSGPRGGQFKKGACHGCFHSDRRISPIALLWSSTMLQDEILSEAIQDFVERNLITDVLHVLKSGKEATVCCCLGHRSIGGGLVGAKGHRPRSRRSFKNDALYRDGKVILSGRARRALANKSEFGRQVQFGTWVNYEWETMNHLHSIGADVPRPIARGENAILMEYIGDETSSAQQLRGISLSPDEARNVFQIVLRNIELC